MKFVEKERSGKVLGNSVKAASVPFSALRRIEESQRDGDATATVEAMADVVGKYVTMDDGSPIDPEELSPAAIKELFVFATGLGAESVADFT